MRTWIRFACIALAVIVIGYVLMHKAYTVHSTYTPLTAHVNTLRSLGVKALRSGDVPVAALLLYNDTVIGRGFNTVLRDANAGGHAEVNAVSDALHTLGPERFGELDRDRLLLLSTYEPCSMCRGLMLEYRIHRVAFIRAKSLRRHLRDDVHAAWIDLLQQRSGPGGLQDSLFELHPAYDPTGGD